MNKKFKSVVLTLIAIVGIFAGGQNVHAATAIANCDNATMYGTVSPNGATTEAWFEWGPSASLPYQTTHQTFSGTQSQSFSQYISGLTPNTTYYYRGMAQNANGTATGQTLTFFTQCDNTPATPTVTLTANPNTITTGQQSTLKWNSVNATSCTGSSSPSDASWNNAGKPIGNQSFVVSPTSTTTYSINCSGATASATVQVNPVQNPTCPDPSSDNPGGPMPCTYNLCRDSTAANYRQPLPCRPQTTTTTSTPASTNTNTNSNPVTVSQTVYNYGSGGGYQLPNNQNNYQTPTVSISADNMNVNYGQGTTVRWYPQNATSCYASGGSNNWSGNRSAFSDSFYTGPLSYTTTYSMTCSNGYGTSNSASVTITVGNGYNGGTGNYSGPTAVTSTATALSNSSESINGLIFTGGTNTNAWFEWGASTNLGNTTPSTSVGTGTSVPESQTLTFLAPRTTYYYRAVAQNSYGTSYGSILSFTTQNSTSTVVVTRPITTVVRVGSGVSTPSLVLLTIDGGADGIAPGERRNYHIHWENTSTQNLTKVVLRVIFPDEMTFESGTGGNFTKNDNTVTLDIENLAPAQTGDLYLVADLKTTVTQQGQLVVVIADMVYTDASNTQRDTVAYATHHVIMGESTLGASAFWAGFIPGTLLGWLILIIIILLILLLLKNLQQRNVYQTTYIPPAPPQPPLH